MVSGHVDGIAEIVSRRDFDGMAHFRFRAPKDLAKFIAVKGSVALDGTSLTVNAVEGDTFEVLLIPHTLKVTTWGERKAGDKVNIEVDQMARYAARLMEAGQGSADRQELRFAAGRDDPVDQAPFARAFRVHEMVAVQRALDLFVSSGRNVWRRGR